MAAVNEYPEIIKGILREYAVKPSLGDVEPQLVYDDAQGHYLLMHAGWIGHRRIHGPVIHIDIHDNKVWLQHDGTDGVIADQLVAAGIPAEDIVLCFHPPYARTSAGLAA